MSLTYGFYNSVNNDRMYNAEQVSSIFDGLVNDGVYMSIGGKMMVKTNTGMTVKIGSGRAWFDHTWTYNDSDFNITLDSSDPLLNRIDAVVLEVDHSTNIRANSFKIIKGNPSSNPSRPELVNDVNVKQHLLAYILVIAGSSEISQANITNMVGTSTTPYVKGLIENISIDDMLAQWQTQFNNWMRTIESQNTQWTTDQHAAWQAWVTNQENAFTSWATEYQTEMENFKTTQQSAFLSWFDSMKDQLSEDAAGNLQLEIDDINSYISELDSSITTITGRVDGIDDSIASINSTLSTKINRTGDSMTGDLTIKKGNLTLSSGKLIGDAQLSGAPTTPTPVSSANNTQIANTAFVKTESATKQNKVRYSTTELTPGSSSLATGDLYVVYQA